MEVVPRTVRALEVAPVDLDAVGFFSQEFHGHPGGGCPWIFLLPGLINRNRHANPWSVTG
jgi:hypothetical protein